LSVLRESCDAGGITELVVNKADILGATFEEFKVGVGEGKYVKLPGWGKDIQLSHIHTRDKLPIGARTLLDLIERHVRPVVGIGTGPRRDDVIWKRD
jgi:adenylosuccinate synthase